MGFLGSGKTTLLNFLLDRRRDLSSRMAVVVNEFGDVGIDGDLLPADMTRQVELPGGCICCVLNEDLDKTLTELLDNQSDLELIVIETTGIAEPLPLSWSLAREPLCERVRLAAIVTTVDVLEHERHRPLSPAVDAQVEYADILAVTKLDLCTDGKIPSGLSEYLRQTNPLAPIITGSHAELADQLWSALDDPERTVANVSGRLSSQQPASHRHPFDAVALPIEQTLDFEELSAQLEELPADYIRIKGIATVIDRSTGSDEPHMIAFHRVGARVSQEPLPAPLQGEAPRTRLVAIGRGVDRAQLAACLDAAVVPCGN